MGPHDFIAMSEVPVGLTTAGLAAALGAGGNICIRTETLRAFDEGEFGAISA